LDLLYADDSVKMSLNPSAFEFLSNPPKNNPYLIIRQKKMLLAENTPNSQQNFDCHQK